MECLHFALIGHVLAVQCRTLLLRFLQLLCELLHVTLPGYTCTCLVLEAGTSLCSLSCLYLHIVLSLLQLALQLCNIRSVRAVGGSSLRLHT